MAAGADYLSSRAYDMIAAVISEACHQRGEASDQTEG
jgi:hypothetical protein